MLILIKKKNLNKKWAVSGLFSYFQSTVESKQNVQSNFSPMTGFEPRTSGIISDRSNN